MPWLVPLMASLKGRLICSKLPQSFIFLHIPSSTRIRIYIFYWIRKWHSTPQSVLSRNCSTLRQATCACALPGSVLLQEAHGVQAVQQKNFLWSGMWKWQMSCCLYRKCLSCNQCSAKCNQFKHSTAWMGLPYHIDLFQRWWLSKPFSNMANHLLKLLQEVKTAQACHLVAGINW